MKRDEYRNTAIFQKAEEILETVKLITDLFPEDDEILKEVGKQLMEDAMLIPAKLASGLNMKLYDIKMENATLIRKSARDLMVGYNMLKMLEFQYEEYYLLVRKQIEEFRLLFIEWVESFNLKHFITDEWGLFNPPGISHDYEQNPEELDFLTDEDEDEDEDMDGYWDEDYYEDL